MAAMLFHGPKFPRDHRPPNIEPSVQDQRAKSLCLHSALTQGVHCCHRCRRSDYVEWSWAQEKATAEVALYR